MRSVLLFLFPFLSPPPAPSTVHGGGTTYSAESARVRGGSYLSIIPDARVAARMRRDPDNISDDLGFRVLRILP